MSRFRTITGFKGGQSPHGQLGIEREVSPTVNANMSALEPTMYSVAFQQNTRDEVRWINGDGLIAGALAANPGMKQQNYIMCLTPDAPQTHRVYSPTAAWPSICANTGKAGQNQQSVFKHKGNQMKAEVRRLTEKECCRLQGIPDDHPFIHGEDTSGSSVYAICGNGWARNCSRLVFKNIHLVDGKHNGGVRPFKIGSVSSGQGTHELSVQDFGDESVFCSEIAPFPCEVLSERFGMPNLGDVTRIRYDAGNGVLHNQKKDGYEMMSEEQLGFKPVDADDAEILIKYGELDCISGGLPCFTKGSYVLTEIGYKPIEDIKVGDKVITHLGNLKRVIRVNNRKADNVIEVKALSRPAFKVTASHPFWTATARDDFRRKSPTYMKTLIETPRFEEIGSIGKGGVVSLMNYSRLDADETIPTPVFPTVYTASRLQIAEICGWYVGDGYISRKNGKRKKEVILCLNDKKYSLFKKTFGGSVHFCDSCERGVYKVHICCTDLAEFIVSNFGELSHSKRIPAWLMFATKDVREAFVKGYIATDGCRSIDRRNSSKGYVMSTVSPSLAYGIADVIGRTTVCSYNRGDTWVIEGRKVNQRAAWQISKSDRVRHYHEYGIWDFVRVKDIKPCEPDTVYNMEVEGDNSYICNGFCVHNCTSVSVAGKRNGAAEGSGTRSALAYELPRIGKECGARWLVYENVPGLMSSNGGTDLAWFLYRLQEAGYSVAWRTLDAQFVRSDTHPRAVPQRRRRIWLVAYRGDDWRVPCEVLFEPMKALGSVPPVRTVGVGFDGKFKAAVLGGSSQEGEPKTELQEFELFLSKADRRILDVLSNAGICVTPEERLKELLSIEMKKSSNGGAGDLFSADLFGDVSATVEPHQGRGLKEADLDLRLPEEGCIRKLKQYEIFEWARTVCSEVLYGGELFEAHEGEPTVDDLTPSMLANLGNAGFLSDGIIYTMKMPEWNAGVTEEELATIPKEIADLYDGDVCGLCDVLDDLVDPKYTLSWRACYGILNRLSKRGKMLPIELGYALVQRIFVQASFVRWQAEFGKDNAPEGKVPERQIAKTCYDSFVEFMIPYSECEPINPKEAGVDCSAEEEAAERMLGDGEEEDTEKSGDDVTEG